VLLGGEPGSGGISGDHAFNPLAESVRLLSPEGEV
jgi:hypothetical protein